MKRSAAVSLALGTALLCGAAGATDFRRPFHVDVGLGYGFDHDPAQNTCDDYACGGKCYDGHRGSDYPLGFGTEVVAGAAGTVVFVNNGCANVGFLGSTCGGGFGNYVQLEHPDGMRSYYAHLRRDSIVVGMGQSVGCGQKLGESASSGSSTGYHLHFEPRAGGAAVDPYKGACSAGDHWIDQGPYNGSPGKECPGGGGGCPADKQCDPGQSQSEGCGDCGSHSRSCNNECKWGSYGACEGPDPNGGNDACASDASGPCAEGRVRCVGGNRSCVPIYEPTPEVCDSIDNDCSGLVDDGAPAELGEPPPAFAAEVVDVSYPQALPAGAQRTAWVEIRNVGTSPWPAYEVWLRAERAAESELRGAGEWPAHDVAAVLDRDVAPGGMARLAFTVTAPDESGMSVTERFHLGNPSGALMACPQPSFEVSITTFPPAAPASAPHDEPGAPSVGESPTAAGCALARRGSSAGGWSLVLLALAYRRRARSHVRALA